MDTQEQIEEYEEKIRQLRDIQTRCSHKWTDAYQDYEVSFFPITENRPMGSDYFNPVTIGFEEKRTPVWRRKCVSCGVKQTTTKTEPVIERHRPVF
ncbi:hypothetical protein KBA63_04150 [Candidatus Woesebacteria bacterium]|nr:hypothetical protein [Candidatus Woesebacteria bacterium]